MKICVVSSTVFAVPLQGYGGLEAIAWHCARGLAAKGHDVILAAPDGSTCPGVRVLHTGVAGQHDEAMAYGKYWSVLKDADAVIDHSWQKWPYVGKAEGWLKAPVLAVMHAAR